MLKALMLTNDELYGVVWALNTLLAIKRRTSM